MHHSYFIELRLGKTRLLHHNLFFKSFEAKLNSNFFLFFIILVSKADWFSKQRIGQ